MSRAEGNKVNADILFDTTWFEYYWGIVEFNRYHDRMKQAMEEAKEKHTQTKVTKAK